MSNPPAGTATFLFTDIEGSTRLWEHHPDGMRAALLRHDVLVRDAIESNSGYVFKTIGDAFCAAFDDPGDAVRAAVVAQRRLHAERWAAYGDGFPRLRARMGLHTGPAELRDGDYFGPSLSRVARLEAAGNGGQVLISYATLLLVRGALPAGTRLRDLGEHRLKDLRHTERVTQIVVQDLPDDTRALRTADTLATADRIVVAESVGADHTATAPTDTLVEPDVPQAMADLLAVVRGDADMVTLTPDQVRAATRRRPASMAEYRVSRIAEWSLPQYRLDGRFVGLTLLIDQGEEAVSGRWQPREERYSDLRDLLAEVPHPAIVLLGPPGSGKSTVMRRLELDTAVSALRGDDPRDTVTFFVPLNHYKPPHPGAPSPAPGEWLAERWASRYPSLPALHALLAEGRVVLLLDALNEMPTLSETEFVSHVSLWKDYLVRLAEGPPGNRVVLTCRTLDYSAPLSTPSLRVPQVRIEPLEDEQVRQFLKAYSPLHWREVWDELAGSRRLEVLRSPYALKLLTAHVEAEGSVPTGHAGLFTSFVRQALRREVEQGNPLFVPNGLLTSRDIRRVTHWRWQSSNDLPERGTLIPRLAALAYGMQVRAADGERSQVRIDYDAALDILADPRHGDIVRAGVALGVLDEDPAANEVMYVHQLVQEYFAGRKLADAPDPRRVQAAWLAADIRPSVADAIAALVPADPLPPLPATGWEETTVLATAMTTDVDAFVRAITGANLALAGRCAGQPDVRLKVSSEMLESLRWALVERSRDPDADLRARIAAGMALGELGDPRLERRSGPHGDYLIPPMVELPGGPYTMGCESAYTFFGTTYRGHVPEHVTALAPFAIGRFAVTNAEWAMFMAAGGYEDERWWGDRAARAWRRGETTDAGSHHMIRWWRNRYRADPAALRGFHETGVYDTRRFEHWQQLVEMPDAAFEAHLREIHPGGPVTAPRLWRDERFNSLAQPVVAICWYEARAYCAWLSAQTGLGFRLPTEAEREAAARDREGRSHAYGQAFEALRANTVETHVRRPTPIGVFPDGDSPEGVADLSGNTLDWTSSAWGEDIVTPDYGYPYDPTDGREDLDTPETVCRVLRGAGWDFVPEITPAWCRNSKPPSGWDNLDGMRLALSAD